MSDIFYIDRLTGRKEKEKVYKAGAVQLFYGNNPLNKSLRYTLLPLVARLPIFSALYGHFQKRSGTVKKIAPFIKNFDVDASEFKKSVTEFRSFNDFFIRELKKEARPIAPGNDLAVIPADGRYYFYQDIAKCDGFIVKGQKFDPVELLGDSTLAQEYAEGAMVMARLCPSDYHRFHFPCRCVPEKAQLINGSLYSVNPLAVKQNIKIYSQNKRKLTKLTATPFGTILYLEIGATNVGSIQETYTLGKTYQKGDEKGYFEFGGSALILLFRKGIIQFDVDLLAATQKGLEMRCLLGQSMGNCTGVGSNH